MISRVRSLIRSFQLVYIEGEIAFFLQMDRNGPAADVMDHRLVDREAGIGINYFISFINQGEDRKENNWLAPGNDDDFLRCNFHSTGAADIVG